MNEVMLLKDSAPLTGDAVFNYKKDVFVGYEFISFLFFFLQRLWEQGGLELACAPLSTQGLRNVYLSRTRRSVVRTREGIKRKVRSLSDLLTLKGEKGKKERR